VMFNVWHNWAPVSASHESHRRQVAAATVVGGSVVVTSAALDPVSPHHLRLLQVLLNDLLVPGAAKATRAPPPLPTRVRPGWHLALFPSLLSEHQLSPDGYLPAFAPPEPYQKRMWAGGHMEFATPRAGFRAGVEAELRLRCAEVDVKYSSRGASAPRPGDERIFVNEDWSIYQDGKLVVKDVRTIVYMDPQRSPAVPASSSKRSPSTEPANHTGIVYSQEVHPSVISLFRYSALTYNAHMIHYDPEYARHVEAHPGVLVHGPLTCTLLLEHVGKAASASEEPGPTLALRRWTYRAVSPLPLGAGVVLKARRVNVAGGAGGGDRREERNEQEWEAWAEAGDDGRVVMTARAEFGPSSSE
ncbi:hypothetical protein HK405_014019, partial [Cladochytrium tenue]